VAELEGNPLLTAAGWERELEALSPAAMLVRIQRRLGERMRRHMGAEDVWQEAVARALKSPVQWQGRVAFQAWMRTVVDNCIRDLAEHVGAAKRGGGQPDIEVFVRHGGADTTDGSCFAGPITTTTPSRIAMDAELAQAMLKALDAVPEPYREVLWLRLFERFEWALIAEITGMPESTARRRYREAGELYDQQLHGASASGVGPGQRPVDRPGSAC
jgi:RNA polymerase sigma-70 factor, ECF subfamily